MVSNTKADLLLQERVVLSSKAFVEIVIWSLRQPLRGSAHRFKYRLAYVEDEHCTVRYDNEAGKGDHRHIEETETPYKFTDLDTLQRDFWIEVDRRRK